MNILIFVISILGLFLVAGLTRTASKPEISKEYRYSKIVVGISLMGACILGVLQFMQFTLDEALLEKYLNEANPGVGVIIGSFVFFVIFVHTSIYYSKVRFFIEDRKLVCKSIYKISSISLTKPHKHIYYKSEGNPAASMHVFKQGGTSIKLTKYIVGLDQLLEEIAECQGNLTENKVVK